LQVLGQAINDTKSIDDAKIAADFHSATFHTVVGDVKFGKDGEWAVPRVIQTQFHDIAGNGVAQFRDVDQTQAVVTPPDYKTGGLIYPYGNAKLPAH
ncbi:MAG: branched-chain amino acid ABC transporter substrate-binding protein, partial [Xanthobacteraceae bacterium]